MWLAGLTCPFFYSKWRHSNRRGPPRFFRLYFPRAPPRPDSPFSPATRTSVVMQFIRKCADTHSRRIRGPVRSDRGRMLEPCRNGQYRLWTHQPRQCVSNRRVPSLRIPPALAIYSDHLFGRTGGGHRDRTATLNAD